MKKHTLRPWRRYALVFVCLLALIGALCRFGPWEEYKDGNLLVHSALAACLTAVCFAVDYVWRKAMRLRNKKNENLNNND